MRSSIGTRSLSLVMTVESTTMTAADSIPRRRAPGNPRRPYGPKGTMITDTKRRRRFDMNIIIQDADLACTNRDLSGEDVAWRWLSSKKFFEFTRLLFDDC
jgi:hypothetical protein